MPLGHGPPSAHGTPQDAVVGGEYDEDGKREGNGHVELEVG